MPLVGYTYGIQNKEVVLCQSFYYFFRINGSYGVVQSGCQGFDRLIITLFGYQHPVANRQALSESLKK